MAKPLPKTKVPDLRKNKKIVKRVSLVADPLSPLIRLTGATAKRFAVDLDLEFEFEFDFDRRMAISAPPTKKINMDSDSVSTVKMAVVKATIHSAPSRFKFFLDSL